VVPILIVRPRRNLEIFPIFLGSVVRVPQEKIGSPGWVFGGFFGFVLTRTFDVSRRCARIYGRGRTCVYSLLDDAKLGTFSK
jgi:hypothetical protein